MHKTIVPSESVGRWVDFEQLDFERQWMRSHTEETKRPAPQGEERTKGAELSSLTYRPFERLASRAARAKP